MILIVQLALLTVFGVTELQPTPNFAGTWAPVEGVGRRDCQVEGANGTARASGS